MGPRRSEFEQIGITGYPESHHLISDDETIRAMFAKAPMATYIVSQICFDPPVAVEWMRAVWERGTRLPIHLGLPGPVEGEKLLRVCERIRVGESLEVLRADVSAQAGVWDPDPLLETLEESLDDVPNFGGFHIFTFNDLADTEHWRQRHLATAAHTP
jgi:methylenetetrahydrofolate reductase (NADPH)